ncbi:MAG: CBS domain-containing protein [Chitinophagales bacterium]|nr:CBS domain-containing protein [Chitinophagales bacterium]
MKISASLYSYSKEKSLEELVRELDAHEIDMLHIDCADDESVFDDIKRIRKISSTPIDLHVISSEPEKYFSKIEELKIEYACLQYENMNRVPKLPQKRATQYGLAFASETATNAFKKAEDNYSFALMMATVPGQSGGTFNRINFQKIIDFKYRYPHTRIHVDGGINDSIAFILRLLGVHVIVSGSYLMNHTSLGAGVLSFHKTPNGNGVHYHISDFFIPAAHLPVVTESETSFKNILQQIEKYGQGFAMITDSRGKLTGVVTNADIRRGLLKHLDNLNEVSSENIINRNPVGISESATLADMLRLLNNLSFIVLFLPVVDAQKKLKGAVLLNNLTRV